MPEDVLAVQLSVTECVVLETPTAATLIFVGEPVALLDTATLPLTVSTCFGENVTSSVAVCPGLIVAPLTPPLVVKSAPVTLIPDTVTLELPVFFRLTANMSEFPTVTFPKLRLVGVAVSNRVAVTPVALSGTTSVLSVALLVNVTLPVTEPVVAEAKRTVQFTACPAPRLIG
jgi:hypothetical protein